MLNKILNRGVLACGLALFSIGTANADLTPVFSPPASEMNHLQILDHIYGAGFSSIGTGVFSNGTVTATRIDDYLATGGPGSPLHLIFGTPGLPTTDQWWVDGIARAQVEAKFAGYNQEFGFDTGSGYQKLFDVSVTGSTGFDVAGSGTATFIPGQPFEWIRDGGGDQFSSVEANNPDGLDHLITYQITGVSANPSDTVWALFWEDLTGPIGGSGGSDRDFNDLVVELRASIVPIPGAWLLGAAGLALTGALRRRLA